MEELLTKIAEIMGLSVEGVLNSYPILRDQYTNIYTLIRISGVLKFLLITLIGLGISYTAISVIDKSAPKVSIKKWGTIFLIGLVIEILINSYIIKLAPDLMFLMKMIPTQ